LDISTFTRRNVGSFTPAIVREIEKLYDDYTCLRSDLNIRVFI
ncbi:MAG: dihydrodipicolinate synthase family protein, partial [Pedobacter sp.]